LLASRDNRFACLFEDELPITLMIGCFDLMTTDVPKQAVARRISYLLKSMP
jgi:hypothetical protein